MTGPRAAALALALCLVGQAAWAQAGGACRPGGTVEETNACAVRDYQEADTAIQIQYGDVMRALSAHERPGLRQDHANWQRARTYRPPLNPETERERQGQVALYLLRLHSRHP